MNARSGYPAGVPCWVDLMQPDVDATMAFYGDLFGWTYDVRSPEGAPTSYAYALLDGLLVGGVGGAPADAAGPSGWTTYVWVDSADATVALVEANGGRVLSAPVDIPHAGRTATCADPSGAVFGLWQAAENRGAELVNAPGSWNFSELTVSDAGEAEVFYGAVFGWKRDPIEISTGQEAAMWRVDGYGDFLADHDPEIRAMQEAEVGPEGFKDAVAIMNPVTTSGSVEAAPGWSVTFAVADADAAFGRATELGATVVTPLFDTDYTRQCSIQDPQGAVLTLSQYRPPSPNE